ncbi:amino acid ABC transporter substrate-binding protein [Cohnella cholangitidis]|uniref:Amino acid ABC transporter substrate-binding protein n=1 Tax=Cohnella cholangitidis TaxID=2598458 RepID=A0A7G5BZP2_9BACL|nr:amino acid ABC transporter substrate-binding protein [Cohnella cholangitidis]QMV42426.1 amino acid ABC transporter substrate-binding protein [Cohnella cholangitidis]
MKRTSLLTLLLTLTVVLLAACGNNSNSASPSSSASPTAPAANTESSSPAAQSSLDEIKASGKIKIGTEGTYAPFTYHDADGKLTGFDVEIAEEVSKRLGVEPEFLETPWDGLIAGLDAKRFDVVFNEVSITDERKQKYDFSDPYIVSKAVLLVHEDNTEITKLADLKGKKSAQSLTSNLTAIAKENGAEIVGTDGFNQAIDLLLTKRVDATINDGLSYLDLKKQKPDVKIKVVDETSEASHSAALIRKGNEELVKAINEALAAMKSDGTYLKISEKYFGTDVSK